VSSVILTILLIIAVTALVVLAVRYRQLDRDVDRILSRLEIASTSKVASRALYRGVRGLERRLEDAEVALVRKNMPSFYKAFYGQTDVIENVPEGIIESLVRNLSLTASVAELDDRLEELQAFADAGQTHLTLGLHDDAADTIRLIGERVIPALGPD